MLKRFNMQNAVPARTPLPHSLPLLKATKLDRRCNQLEYTEITGSLNHLAVYSRPDIAFAISTLSQFNSDPTTTHLHAARHVLRYLINTANYSITYGDSDLIIHGYADRPANEPSVLGARLGSGPPNRDRTQFLCSAETETETEQEHSPRDRTETEQPPPRAETEHLPLNLGSARFGLNCSGNLDI